MTSTQLCYKCNIPLSGSIALVNTWTTGMPDFDRDIPGVAYAGQTIFESNQTVVVRCLKCSSCGHSVGDQEKLERVRWLR